METGKIVIVDDEKIVTDAFKTLLRVEGFSDVEIFNNPKEAIKYLKKKYSGFGNFGFYNA